MEEKYIKKYWEEEDIYFYIHFKNNIAVRQLEITSKGKIYLTLENPTQGELMLYDQSLDELDLEESDFITENEFNKIWDE